jgi:hypothetical protein
VEVGGHPGSIRIKSSKEISDRLKERQCQRDTDNAVDQVAEWNTAAGRISRGSAFQRTAPFGPSALTVN